ncbi:MAG: AAA family ATPase [Candidatus Omnitrophica bacterium]|nr:AAA family ATPase [Candidatus Omnitrophota bacterium]
MGKKIVCVGRGGVGKSSFLGGAAFLLHNKSPLLIVDADPDESLISILGIKDNLKTISEVLFNIKEGSVSQDIKNFSLPEKIDYLLQHDALYEGDFFDFISLGIKWSEGCYCQPNNILKGTLGRLEKNYNFVLLDSPAGLEHINRRITNDVDYLFILLDPSQKSLQGVAKLEKLLKDIKINCRNTFLVANFRFPEESLRLIKEKTSLEAIGKLPHDKELEKINLEGKSFSHLDKSSPFLISLKEILEKTGIL